MTPILYVKSINEQQVFLKDMKSINIMLESKSKSKYHLNDFGLVESVLDDKIGDFKRKILMPQHSGETITMRASLAR